MMTEICENCKHSELCEGGCAFFEEKERGPFYMVSGPSGQVHYILVQPEGKAVCIWEGGRKNEARAVVACEQLNELWSGRKTDE